MTLRKLLDKLREAGSIGLDGSPGDPLCATAGKTLAHMWDLLETVERDLAEISKRSSPGPCSASVFIVLRDIRNAKEALLTLNLQENPPEVSP